VSEANKLITDAARLAARDRIYQHAKSRGQRMTRIRAMELAIMSGEVVALASEAFRSALSHNHPTPSISEE